MSDHTGFRYAADDLREDLEPLDDSAQQEPSKAEVSVAIEHLAALSPFEYDRCRETEAKRLGVRVSTLDDEVKRRRPRIETNAGAGSSVLFDTPEPWPQPIDGAALLDAIAEALIRHAVLPAHADTAIALWIMLTYTHAAASVCPILALTSPEKRCGKTTVLSLLRRLCHRPLAAANITAATLFRAVEQWQPCLLIDEADTFLRQSDELRGVLNSGHTRDTAYVIRTVGEDHEPRRFATWSPKTIACIGEARDTIMDRSIVISMRRKLPSETVTRLRYSDRYTDLVSQSLRWAADHIDALHAAEPDLPGGLHDRAADNWTPLLAIADTAGGHWPQRAREAARILSGGEAVEDTSTRVQLLADIRAVFETRGADRIRSTDLVDALIDMEDRPWPEWRQGKPLTPAQLAQLLRPFGIVRGTRRAGGDTFKGYCLRQFDDAFGCYLPSQSVTRSQPACESHLRDDLRGHATANVTAQKSAKPAPRNNCDRVTAQSTGYGERAWIRPEFTIIEGGQSRLWSIRYDGCRDHPRHSRARRHRDRERR
jgi:putative DNA primase/helicase